VDFSPLADRALQEAFALASQRVTAKLHVLSVLPVASDDPGHAISVYAALDETAILDTAIGRLRAHVQSQLDEFIASHPAASVTFEIVCHAHVDTAAHGIAQLASDLGADLIVIGTRNPKGLERLLLGSVAEGTVRYAHCPVLVIPAPPQVDASTQIAPPCSECVRARAASGGTELWCAQHREKHGRRHTYHQSDRSSSESNLPLVFR